MPSTTQEKKTLNHDVAGLYRRMNRFIVEMCKCASSGLPDMLNEFDKARLLSYLGAIRSYVNWITAQPQLDLPETSPMEADLDEDPEIPEIENESAKDIVRMLCVGRDEVVYSQSSRHSSGLVEFDKVRLLAVIDKVDNFVSEYLETATPIDLPESSPDTPITGPGRTGI